MKTLLIAIVISLLASTSFAAGHMQYNSDADIGRDFGESTLRFAYAIGLRDSMDLEEITRLTSILLKAGYYAGKENKDLEEGVQSYLTEFNKAYKGE